MPHCKAGPARRRRHVLWLGGVSVLLLVVSCATQRYAGKDRQGKDQWEYDCDPEYCGDNVNWSSTQGWNSSCALLPDATKSLALFRKLR